MGFLNQYRVKLLIKFLKSHQKVDWIFQEKLPLKNGGSFNGYTYKGIPIYGEMILSDKYQFGLFDKKGRLYGFGLTVEKNGEKIAFGEPNSLMFFKDKEAFPDKYIADCSVRRGKVRQVYSTSFDGNYGYDFDTIYLKTELGDLKSVFPPVIKSPKLLRFSKYNDELYFFGEVNNSKKEYDGYYPDGPGIVICKGGSSFVGMGHLSAMLSYKFTFSNDMPFVGFCGDSIIVTYKKIALQFNGHRDSSSFTILPISKEFDILSHDRFEYTESSVAFIFEKDFSYRKENKTTEYSKRIKQAKNSYETIKPNKDLSTLFAAIPNNICFQFGISLAAKLLKKDLSLPKKILYNFDFKDTATDYDTLISYLTKGEIVTKDVSDKIEYKLGITKEQIAAKKAEKKAAEEAARKKKEEEERIAKEEQQRLEIEKMKRDFVQMKSSSDISGKCSVEVRFPLLNITFDKNGEVTFTGIVDQKYEPIIGRLTFGKTKDILYGAFRPNLRLNAGAYVLNEKDGSQSVYIYSNTKEDYVSKYYDVSGKVDLQIGSPLGLRYVLPELQNEKKYMYFNSETHEVVDEDGKNYSCPFNLAAHHKQAIGALAYGKGVNDYGEIAYLNVKYFGDINDKSNGKYIEMIWPKKDDGYYIAIGERQHQERKATVDGKGFVLYPKNDLRVGDLINNRLNGFGLRVMGSEIYYGDFADNEFLYNKQRGDHVGYLLSNSCGGYLLKYEDGKCYLNLGWHLNNPEDVFWPLCNEFTARCVLDDLSLSGVKPPAFIDDVIRRSGRVYIRYREGMLAPQYRTFGPAIFREMDTDAETARYKSSTNKYNSKEFLDDYRRIMRKNANSVEDIYFMTTKELLKGLLCVNHYSTYHDDEDSEGAKWMLSFATFNFEYRLSVWCGEDNMACGAVLANHKIFIMVSEIHVSFSIDDGKPHSCLLAKTFYDQKTSDTVRTMMIHAELFARLGYDPFFTELLKVCNWGDEDTKRLTNWAISEIERIFG